MAHEVRILGKEEVQKRLRQMAEQVASARGDYVLVGTVNSPVEYAPGIEYGRHPGGKLARAAGGTFALTDAVEQIGPQVPELCEQALARGEPVMRGLMRAGLAIEAQTKVNLSERLYNQPIPLSKRGKPRWRRTGNLRAAFGVR